jgi:hypothetical protein
VKLLATLAAGIRGAEGGTAYVYRHRTTQLATLYSDVHAKDPTETSPVTLDDYGGAVRYVNEWVDVVAYSYSGDIVRQWTEMETAPACEVISSHFTGADPVTGQTGVSKPVDLLTVLELLDTEINNLEVISFYYVVTYSPYSAEGDGTADDAAAIQAAIDACHAAGGGTVYFPGGVYRVTSTITQYADVRLLGAGPSASYIMADLDEDDVLIAQAAETDGEFIIQNLSLGLLDPGGPSAYTAIESSGGALAERCSFVAQNVWFAVGSYSFSICADYSAAGLDASVTMAFCRFYAGGQTMFTATATAPNDVYVPRVTLVKCDFINESATLSHANVTADHLTALGCHFNNDVLEDSLANDSNVVVTAQSDGAQICGCFFSRPTEPLDTGYAIESHGESTVEAGNTISKFQKLFFYAAVDDDNVQIASSRADRSLADSTGGGTYTADTLSTGTLKLVMEGGSAPDDALTVTLPAAPGGWKFTLLFVNSGTSQIDVTLSGLIRAASASAIDTYAVNALSYELRTFQSVEVHGELGWIYDSTPWGDVLSPT